MEGFHIFFFLTILSATEIQVHLLLYEMFLRCHFEKYTEKIFSEQQNSILADKTSYKRSNSAMKK